MCSRAQGPLLVVPVCIVCVPFELARNKGFYFDSPHSSQYAPHKINQYRVSHGSIERNVCNAKAYDLLLTCKNTSIAVQLYSTRFWARAFAPPNWQFCVSRAARINRTVAVAYCRGSKLSRSLSVSILPSTGSAERLPKEREKGGVACQKKREKEKRAKIWMWME